MGGSSSGSSSSSFGSRARTKPAAGGSPLDQDLGSILGTPDSDTAGVDTSIGGKEQGCQPCQLLAVSDTGSLKHLLNHVTG